jgi:hypothetical protein
MGFHRRTTPTYVGGLPSGYDYINNPPLNGDPGAIVVADGKKSSGVNQGTYFVAFGEPATSSNTNRGLNALAENCDILDDYVRGAQPVMRKFDVAGGGSVVASVVLTSTAAYVGSGSDSPATVNDQATRNRLFKVVDQNDNEIEVSGATVQVTAVHDGGGGNYIGNVVGGFVANPTLDFNPPIPAGVNYRIYFGFRRNLVEILTQKPGEYFYEQVRTAHRVDGDVQALFRTLHNAAGTGTWNAAWPSTVDDLRYGGFDRTYRNGSAKPSSSPDTDRYTLNASTAGAGAWLKRDGRAVSYYTDNAAMYADPTQALQRLVFTDTTQSRGSVGLLIEGSRRDGYAGIYAGESDRFGGLASFLAVDVRRNTGSVHASNPLTRIIAGSSVTLTTPDTNTITGEAVVELPAGQYFRKTTTTSEIALAYDMIRLRFTQAAVVHVRDYVITHFGSSADSTSLLKARIRCLDGTVPDFTGASSATVVEWLRWSVGIGDGNLARFSEENGVTLFGLVSGETDVASYVNGLTVLSSNAPSTGLGEPTRVRIGSRGNDANAPLLEIGSLSRGEFIPIFKFLGGDPIYTATKGTFKLSSNARISEALNISSQLGTFLENGSEPAVTVTSAVTAKTLDLAAYRCFVLNCNSSVTSFQNVAITFGAAVADIGDFSTMRILFTQSPTGFDNVKMTWPASAKFETTGDSQPAVGSSVSTLFTGTYVNGNWYFTKRVY